MKFPLFSDNMSIAIAIALVLLMQSFLEETVSNSDFFFKCQLERPETKEVKLESLFNIFSIVNLFTFRETEGEKKKFKCGVF